MQYYEILTAQLINGASFVVIGGVAFHVETVVDPDGFFWVTDDSGEEREFHVNSVDHVEVN